MKSLYENLSEPAPLEDGALRVIPLGGLGEVGRNMNVLEYRGKLLVVDCGVLFPEESQPGVDLILPDFSWIEERMDDVVGLVLTHGHEDHIGAVPYLLKLRGDIPVYGSDLTLAFVAPKLREHRLADPGLNVVAEGDRLTVGPFDLEFVSVTHSIPDALAVFVRTQAGKVLITGVRQDWTSCPWIVASPTCGPSLAWVRRASTCSWWTPRMRWCPDRSRRSARSARSWIRCSARRPARSSLRPSPPTCTASSRSSTPPPTTGAVSPSWVAPWSATWRIAEEKGYLSIPEGVIVDLEGHWRAGALPARLHGHRFAGRADGGPVAHVGRLAPLSVELSRVTWSSWLPR